MEDHNKKNPTSSDIPSPVLLRRRLSAPETIMRKHTLAQQRSNSQDSDSTQASDARSCNWRMERGIGSDSNLNRKRDHNLMRKSTLMRRLWGSNKPLVERNARFSTSYYDWQYLKLGRGKSTQSLDSNHSSPEHVRYRHKLPLNEEFVTSSAYKSNESTNRKTQTYSKFSLKNQSGEFDQSSNLKQKIPNGNYSVRNTPCCDNCLASLENPQSSVNSTLSKAKTSTTLTTTTTTTETESEYYSNRSTSTTGTTTFSDNSDSAYTLTHSNFTQTSNGNSSVCTSTYSSEKFLEENGNVEENENSNQFKNTEFSSPKVMQQNNNSTVLNNDKTKLIPESVNDSSTQTSDIANLNVISNVQLSQSTLNMIFNQVMQDVKKFPTTNINISTVSAPVPILSEVNKAVPKPNVIEVQKGPSFYLKRKEDVPNQEEHRISKFMVSKVGTGSPYSKPTEVPQVVVPRYSALPRTTSMEVNTSSGESTDRESDNISLVDSLEDPNSPRPVGNQNKYDDKPVRGDLSPLLPDNSNSQVSKTEHKSSAFFIPIKTNASTDVKSVADHLPEKVRERLSKRQLKREQKLRQAKDKVNSPKSDSNYVSASDNGNQLHGVVDKYGHGTSGSLFNANSIKNKRKGKPSLPSIEPVRKFKTESKATLKYPELDKLKDKKISKLSKRKMMNKSQESHRENYLNEKKQIQWMSKTRQKVLERLSPLYTTKSEYVYEVVPKRAYHKTEVGNTNKRIEILEIVECIETIPKSGSQRTGKLNKSKIPVLVNSKLPSISKTDKSQRPAFLDFDQFHETEPKIDQLIANILIDALNKNDVQNLSDETQLLYTAEKRPTATPPSQIRHQGNKYQQMFEAIPEERAASLQSSSEDGSNSAGDTAKTKKSKKSGNSVTKDLLKSGNSESIVPDGYKGKAALGIIKDENFATIPKGWITFYTLHKSQGSPESTSDEGKKKLSGNETPNFKEDLKKRKHTNAVAQNENAINEKLNKSKNTDGLHYTQQDLISSESKANHLCNKEQKLLQQSTDTWSSSDQEKHTRVLHSLSQKEVIDRNQQRNGRCDNCGPTTNNKFVSGGWTVMVSGSTSEGQHAPDVEMRLSFPRNLKQKHQSNIDLGDGNSNEKKENFPYLISPKQTNSSSRTDNSCSIQQLPHITKHRSARTASQTDISHHAAIHNYGKIEPRPTRTSTKRLLLNRPRTFIAPAEFVDIDPDDSNLKSILSKFPEILRITGNAINPEHKPKVPTMSEKDITRNMYRNNF